MCQLLQGKASACETVGLESEGGEVIYVAYDTPQLRSMVRMGEQVIADTQKLLASTQKYVNDPFWKKERERMKRDIKKIAAENKAYIAELKRRGEWNQ
jgi:hypothetical protein